MNIAVILASGSGERLQHIQEKKCFIEVCNKPLFSFSLETFLHHDQIDKVVLCVPSGYIEKAKKYIDDEKVVIIEGDDTRQKSVFKALETINDMFKANNPFILIHDGARPLISSSLISRHLLIKEIGANEGSYTSIGNYDSLIVQDGSNYVRHIDRNHVYKEQTPTCAYLDKFLNAFKNSKIENSSDDISLLIENGYHLVAIEGDILNFKITTYDELELFKRLVS